MKDYIKSMSSLPVGWNGYDADPPNQETINKTLILMDIFEHYDRLPDSVSPSAEGGIGITFISNDKYTYMEISNEGPIVLLIDNPDGSDREIFELDYKKIEQLKFSLSVEG